MKITSYIDDCPVCKQKVKVAENPEVPRDIFIISKHMDEDGKICGGSNTFLYINTNKMYIGPRKKDKK